MSVLGCLIGLCAGCEGLPDDGDIVSAEEKGAGQLDLETESVRAALGAPYDIGVIPDVDQACPGEEVLIHMDDENTSNANARSGWIGRNTSTTNTTFRFCRVSGTAFRPARSSNSNMTYAVLRLATLCPAGSVPFTRHFDNEDKPRVVDVLSGQGTHKVGDIAPSISNKNTTMELCLFRASLDVPTSTPFPELGIRYGVFGSVATALASGWLYTDDEDDNNANRLSGDHAGSGTVLTANRNTMLFMSRVR
jgi:hypothetical protein